MYMPQPCALCAYLLRTLHAEVEPRALFCPTRASRAGASTTPTPQPEPQTRLQKANVEHRGMSGPSPSANGAQFEL